MRCLSWIWATSLLRVKLILEADMARILLIDDEEIMRETLADCLISAGHSVDQAENGKVALELLGHIHCDLIILDVFMPEMDGIELIRVLRTRSDSPPIITISGGGGVLPPKWSSAMTEVYDVASSLTKPLDMTVFLDSVEQALK